jgi:hypothetical protein
MGRELNGGQRVKTRDQTVEGWTWGAFGIDRRGGLDWTATHLPTGFHLAGGFPTQAMAQQFCREIDGFTDWTTLGVPTLNGVPQAFRDAYFDAAERARAGEKEAV